MYFNIYIYLNLIYFSFSWKCKKKKNNKRVKEKFYSWRHKSHRIHFSTEIKKIHIFNACKTINSVDPGDKLQLIKSPHYNNVTYIHVPG